MIKVKQFLSKFFIYLLAAIPIVAGFISGLITGFLVRTALYFQAAFQEGFTMGKG